jgi:long-chain acyl-CoA synthetase
MNTADYLLETADDERPALLLKGQEYTYGQLRAACARVAGELAAVGIQAGDFVGILGENSLFWVAAYLAALKLNAVAVPFPTVCTADDLVRKQCFVRCKVMCADGRLLARYAGALKEELTLVSDEVLRAPGPSRWDPPQDGFDVDQDAALMLTSGTTALPRAVRITHRNIQANTGSIAECLALDSGERILVVLPFYYCFGTSLLHTHLRAGGSMALCNTFLFPETALEMLEARQCTGIAGVPSTFQTLLRNSSFRNRQFPRLKKVQQAGGKLQPVLIRELMSAVPQAQLFIMYRQTEATARLSCLPPALLEKKLGSVGKGIPGVVLRVLHESGRDVQPGEVGEIVAWGDSIAPGYLGDSDASAIKFAGGSLRTEDLATVDDEGYIYIVDRKSDFIKCLGHRVSSQEVEARILEIQDVVSAAVIGHPDPICGEAIIIFVTLREGSRLTPAEIIRHCRASMARHLVPKEVIRVDSLPINGHGKVVKSLLRQSAEGLLGKGAAVRSPGSHI